MSKPNPAFSKKSDTRFTGLKNSTKNLGYLDDELSFFSYELVSKKNNFRNFGKFIPQTFVKEASDCFYHCESQNITNGKFKGCLSACYDKFMAVHQYKNSEEFFNKVFKN